MTSESFRELEAALLSPLDTLRSVDPSQATLAADQLATSWEKVRDRIEWL
jgi:hypothetical protein